MPPHHPVVFIGSSTHGLPVARQVADLIKCFADPRVWDEVFGPTGGTFQDLTGIIPRVDAAVLILTPDDRLSQQREGRWSEPLPSPRDNVVFEVGLWIGALGRERVVFLHSAEEPLVIPSDLAGVNSIRCPPGITNPDRLWDEAQGKLKQWLCGRELRQHTRPVISWPTPHAEGADLLRSGRGEAQHGLLLLGNTMAQTQAADQGDLARWLALDRRRRVGLLFLNPHSPHASGRDRPHLHRGTCESGFAAYRQALRQSIHPQCLPLLYEGPYRYSLRGIDIAPHTRNAASEVHITHSTHHRGIAGGFSHSLPYHRGAEAFESFASDVLSLWKAAQANPPGHGLTLAACWEPDSGPAPDQMEVVLAHAAKELVEGTAGTGEFHLNRAAQWHFTLCSLKRTGPPWGGPLSLTAETADERLPSGFREYAVRSCEQLRSALCEAGVHELAPEVTHLSMSQTGCLIAFNPETPVALSRALAKFLASRPEELARLDLDTTPGGPFAPKHFEFWPHVSVGMAFHNKAALPEPLTSDGKGRVVRLSRPLSWRTSRFYAVHYAYRTFLRNIGAFPIRLESGPIDGSDMVRALGIV
jgi:hypothetical protein